jgi:hypothetical protein
MEHLNMATGTGGGKQRPTEDAVKQKAKTPAKKTK